MSIRSPQLGKPLFAHHVRSRRSRSTAGSHLKRRALLPSLLLLPPCWAAFFIGESMQRAIGRLRARASGSVSLAALLAALYPASEQGAVYEGDFASGYQESTGITAVTAADDPSGLRLDKRFALARGAQNLVDPGFDDATKWTTDATWSVAGSSLTLTNTLNTAGPVGTTAVSIVAGTYYELTPIASAITLSGFRSMVGGTTQPSAMTAAGSYHYILPATNTNAPSLIANGTSSGVFSSFSVQAVPGNHALQATTSSRPLEKLIGTNYAEQFDGVDDSQVSAAGGGGTTGFFWCGAVKVIGGAGSSRSVWSDTGTNTGYRVRIASTNKLAIGAGDGVGFTSATTTDAVDVGNTYVLTVWDDGANLNAQVNLGTAVQAARPVVSAGTASFTRGKENGSATLFANVAVLAEFYKKNGGVDAATRLSCQQYCAAKAGITI